MEHENVVNKRIGNWNMKMSAINVLVIETWKCRQFLNKHNTQLPCVLSLQFFRRPCFARNIFIDQNRLLLLRLQRKNAETNKWFPWDKKKKLYKHTNKKKKLYKHTNKRKTTNVQDIKMDQFKNKCKFNCAFKKQRYVRPEKPRTRKIFNRS